MYESVWLEARSSLAISFHRKGNENDGGGVQTKEDGNEQIRS